MSEVYTNWMLHHYKQRRSTLEASDHASVAQIKSEPKTHLELAQRHASIAPYGYTPETKSSHKG